MKTEITNDELFYIKTKGEQGELSDTLAGCSTICIFDNFEDFDESMYFSLEFEDINKQKVEIGFNLKYRELIRIKKAIESHLESVQHFYLQNPNKEER